MQRIIFITALITATTVSPLVYAESTSASILSFEDCVAAGNPVMEMYPARCVTSDNKEFIQKVAKSDVKLCKDLCGDGTCQEMVCQAVGCPCAESKESCPKDCVG